jgi:hypothetical protein
MQIHQGGQFTKKGVSKIANIVDGAVVVVKVHRRQRLMHIGNLWWDGAAQLILGKFSFFSLSTCPSALQITTTAGGCLQPS